MNLSQLFHSFQLEKVRLNTAIVRADITFETADRDAAWELYIEMLTRIVTQPLPSDVGDEETALASVFSLFSITREILRRRGRRTVQFSKVAIPVLNRWFVRSPQNGIGRAWRMRSTQTPDARCSAPSSKRCR